MMQKLSRGTCTVLVACLLGFNIQAQTANSPKLKAAPKAQKSYSETLKTYGDIHQLKAQANAAGFRTNRHLRFFDPAKPLYCQIRFWDENFTRPRDDYNGYVIRQAATIVWTTFNFTAHKRGKYEVEFAQEGETCQIRYTFVWQSKAAKSPQTADVKEEAFECAVSAY